MSRITDTTTLYIVPKVCCWCGGKEKLNRIENIIFPLCSQRDLVWVNKNAKHIKKVYNKKGECVIRDGYYICDECAPEVKRQHYQWEEVNGYLPD